MNCFSSGEYTPKQNTTSGVQEVAIKVMKSVEGAIPSDLMKEVQTMATLKHNNIISLIGVILAGKFFFASDCLYSIRLSNTRLINE